MSFDYEYLSKVTVAKKEGRCFYCSNPSEHENMEGTQCDALELPVCNEHWDFGPNRIYIDPPGVAPFGYR